MKKPSLLEGFYQSIDEDFESVGENFRGSLAGEWSVCCRPFQSGGWQVDFVGLEVECHRRRSGSRF